MVALMQGLTLQTLTLYTFWMVAAAILFVGATRWRGRGGGRRGLLPFVFRALPALVVFGAIAVHARARTLLPTEFVLVFDAVFIWSAVSSLAGDHPVTQALRHRPAFRLGVRLPGQVFQAASIMSTVWIVVMLPVRALLWGVGAEAALEALRYADFAPILLALASIATSSRERPIETVRIEIAKDGPERVTPIPVERHVRRAPAPSPSELRIVQITDPHLGPWQPVAKLRRHIERLVDLDPHLVLLTGDYLTYETNGSPEALAEALSPLAPLRGRCFAVFGNHDHEAPDTVRRALAENHVELLVDAEAIAETPVGSVQLVGSDFVRGDLRRERIRALLDRYPRRTGQARILMLHDPSGFADVPPGEVDLTLSGHTHGGHVGWVGLGLHWTVVRRFGLPDQGLFANGSNRLYVHRGTGFYGFPLRVGIPPEASILQVDVGAPAFGG